MRVGAVQPWRTEKSAFVSVPVFDGSQLRGLRDCLAEGDQKFSLSTAYANRSVYLIWSQVWAVVIFHESLSVKNIIGLLVVLVGVMVVQRYE